MLRATAEVQFTTQNGIYDSEAGRTPMFVVGGSFLFAGTIKGPVKKYLSNRKYTVDILLDIDKWEIYRCLRSMLARDSCMKIREGNKDIGEAKILTSGFQFEK